MIQKVLNETPFQVLSDTFSISPSTTGYQLQVSANGKDYSTLFSVGAGVTRMCTGMANGSFYRLLGNEGEVAVNWRTSCKSGSGGGSGSGSTVVVNQILSAGTQIASIQVDNQTTMLYAPEGGEGGDGLVHLETLSGATGETNVVYECDEELFWWNENSGYTALWANGRTTSGSQNARFEGLTFSTPPQGTVLMTFGARYYNTYMLMFAGNTLVCISNNTVVFEVEPETIYTKRLQGFDIRIKYDKHYIGICMEPVSPNSLVVSQIWDGITVNPHWELVDKNVYPYVYATNEAQFYQVNQKGLPTATGIRLSSKVSYINGSSYPYYGVTDYPNMFVPTVGGTAGQILQSNGNAAPTWVNMPGGGGIEKVSELPASAETGDMVWLEGKTLTGYTILVKEEARPGYVYETSADYYSIDNEDISDSPGYYNIGQWSTRLSNGQTGIMIRSRVQTGTDYPLFDIIDLEGTHTIGVGPDGVSITSGVSFPMKGCLYVYEDGEWFRKPTFEHIYQNATDGADIFNKIQYSIEEFGLEDFVMRYNPNIPTDMREFVPYRSCYFGIDFQAIDSRRRDIEYGRISVVDYRLSANGTFQDIVGEHWIVSEDQINIPQVVGVTVNSAGTITEADGLNLLSSMFNVSNRVCFNCSLGEDNKFSSAPLKWWYRQNEQVDGDTKLFYYACVEIPIEGTVYKGVWKWAEYEYPDPFVPQSWTAVQ